jgi:glutathione S-transferase
MDYISVDEAKTRKGMRLVLTRDKPGPWGEAAKAIFAVKGIDYTPVAQYGGMENKELFEWTGQSSAPVAIYNDESPKTQSLDILFLAERIQPETSLIPLEASSRALMFGLIREIIGEQGFGWSRRLMIFRSLMGLKGLEEISGRLASKYGYEESLALRAPDKVAEILALLTQQLALQKKLGSPYFIGEKLSALDLYWAVFSIMLKALDKRDCPMDEGMKAAYEVHDKTILAASDPLLIAHRDYIFSRYIHLPLDF